MLVVIILSITIIAYFITVVVVTVDIFLVSLIVVIIMSKQTPYITYYTKVKIWFVT